MWRLLVRSFVQMDGLPMLLMVSVLFLSVLGTNMTPRHAFWPATHVPTHAYRRHPPGEASRASYEPLAVQQRAVGQRHRLHPGLAVHPLRAAAERPIRLHRRSVLVRVRASPFCWLTIANTCDYTGTDVLFGGPILLLILLLCYIWVSQALL